MKKLFSVWFIFLNYNFITFAQATKPVTVKFKDSKEVFENYSVLKSDRKIKHGEYRAYFNPDNYNVVPLSPPYFLRVIGNFINGKKNGEWTEYLSPGEMLSKGNYENDKKVGVWEFRKENGQVIDRFDYTNNKHLAPEIKVHINYPRNAVKKNIEGKVKIKYRIQPDCLITDIVVIESLSPECDKAAIEAITKFGEYSKKYEFPCEPGTQEKTFNFSIQ